MIVHENQCGIGMEHTVRVGNNFIPNHHTVFNSTTGVLTDLVITDVTLEDDNTVYTCNSTDDNITSSVVLNALGKLYVCVYML